MSVHIQTTSERHVFKRTEVGLCQWHQPVLVAQATLWRDFWGRVRGCDGREEMEPKLYTDCGWNLSQTWLTVLLLLPSQPQQPHSSWSRWGSEERSHSQPSLGWMGFMLCIWTLGLLLYQKSLLPSLVEVPSFFSRSLSLLYRKSPPSLIEVFSYFFTQVCAFVTWSSPSVSTKSIWLLYWRFSPSLLEVSAFITRNPFSLVTKSTLLLHWKLQSFLLEVPLLHSRKSSPYLPKVSFFTGTPLETWVWRWEEAAWLRYLRSPLWIKNIYINEFS